MDRLVCSAANRSTIDIKSWFILVDGPTVRRLVSHLKLMHRYHRVRINVFVGRNWYVRRHRPGAYRNFKRIFKPFAHVATCGRACRSTVPNGSSHSKWVTVSKLRNSGRTAVLSTSMNISTGQFGGTRQTGTLIVGNHAVYNAFLRRWNSFEACARNAQSRACGRRDTAHQPTARWQGTRGTYSYFAPASNDPIAYALSRVRCSHSATHRFIQIASLKIDREHIIEQLHRLRSEGCHVRVLVEHKSPAVTSLHPRCGVNHDKTLIIDTAHNHLVFTGAEDFTWFSLHVSDNQMVRTNSRAVLADYKRFYGHLWQRGGSCGNAPASTPAALRAIGD